MKSLSILIFYILIVFSVHAGVRKRPIVPGINHYALKLLRIDGPVVVNILSIDLSERSERDVRISMAGSSVCDREKLSGICRKKRSIAGVNGSYFGEKSGPLGLVMIDGELVSIPILKRAAFGIKKDRKLVWGHPVFHGVVEFCDRRDCYKLDGINQLPGRDSILLYTHEFGLRTPEYRQCMEYVIVRDRIVDIGYGGILIPPGGYVLSVYDEGLREMRRARLMEKVTVMRGLERDWSGVRFAVSGGPRLIKESNLVTSWEKESIKRNISHGRARRTAVGMTGSGKLILVVVDGRQPDYSIGMTLEELSELMGNLGCVEALNLDGGGSSTMVIWDEVVNRPSDGKEREINNAVLVF